MELNTTSLSDFVKLAGVIWEKTAQSLPREAYNSGMYMVDPIPANSGNTREYSEIDLQEYAKRKAEGDQAERAKVQQGYNKVMTAVRFGCDIGITYEMRSQNKYTDVTRRLTNLTGLIYNRMELDLSHRFTFATATSYTDMDGYTVDTTVGDETLCLASTAHTVRGTSSTYRNVLANNPQFSKGSLESMEKMCNENTVNQFGEKVFITRDVIWSTDDPNTVNTISEVLRSMASVNATHAGVMNVYKGKYRHVILPRVATDANGAVDSTKAKYWGLAATSISDAHLGIWEEPRMKLPSDLNAGEEFSTDDWNFGARGGYGIAIVSGRWFSFSDGLGTA